MRRNPTPGITLDVKFIRAIDGDTYECEITRRFNVRLRGIDTFEKNTENGKFAILLASDTLKQAKEITIFIPTNDPIKLMDFDSFERIVADVFHDGLNLKATMEPYRKPKQDEKLGPKNRQ